MKKFFSRIVPLIVVIALTACGNGNDENDEQHTEPESAPEESLDKTGHEHIDHSSSGEVPENLKVEENPAFEVGSKALINHGHMPGMEGTEATIVGAYHTNVYAVSYTSTTGGERVEEHKWVIHEELKDAGEEPFEPGTEVTLEADHMEGMKGALAEIDFVEETTVYMVDFTLTTDGEEIKNHKWVTEDELSPIEHH
ncbi:YdhK family protein [Halalkalibacter urbisdiaboli]|uniref:YdhK family protein n=1 Tax=Halalkalibacter urbisdiaboli TaxID=1960589 RepID=UPI000B447D07|nr:YdhK family protein [Halalkalibacter urbisdiaboli]